MHERNSFITLTYSDKHLPADKSINVRHWQLFCKRLRKLHAFRYLQCGEYGEGKGIRKINPHYHACIFGLNWDWDRKYHHTNDQGDDLYTSHSLDTVWGLGHCLIGDLSFESAGYVARYAMKKQMGAQRSIKEYGYMEHVDVETGEVTIGTRRAPPFITMSRNPGLGTSWYEAFSGDLYPRDECIINGIKTRPPAFYDRLFEIADPVGHAKLKMARRKAGYKHRENNTYDRLKVRETVKEAKLKMLDRTSHLEKGQYN